MGPDLLSIAGAVAAALLLLVALAVVGYLAYFLISLPLRRQERASVLIDLLEAQQKQGLSLNETIREMSQTRDPVLGVRFHLLADHMSTGKSFSEAIRLVPRLLPAGIQQVLLAGEALNDYRKVLPICRHMLQDAAGTVRNVSNHLTLPLLLIVPSTLILWIILRGLKPKLEEVFPRFEETLPWFLSGIMQAMPGALALFILIAGWLLLWAFSYAGGPRLQRWIEAGVKPVTQPLALLVPWRRKRLLRNFSLMLGLLLDEGVPDAEAVEIAARATANSALQKRADKCIGALDRGESLEQAIMRLDRIPELGWRLRLAARSAPGFRAALRGWWEWLHSRAAQQEQAAVQFFFVGIVAFNGLLIAVIASSVFWTLINIIEEELLW